MALAAVNALKMENLQDSGKDWFSNCFALVGGEVCWVQTVASRWGVVDRSETIFPEKTEVKVQTFTARSLSTGDYVAEARVPVGDRVYAKASDFFVFQGSSPGPISEYQKQLHQEHARRVGLDVSILPWVRNA